MRWGSAAAAPSRLALCEQHLGAAGSEILHTGVAFPFLWLFFLPLAPHFPVTAVVLNSVLCFFWPETGGLPSEILGS